MTVAHSTYRVIHKTKVVIHNTTKNAGVAHNTSCDEFGDAITQFAADLFPWLCEVHVQGRGQYHISA